MRSLWRSRRRTYGPSPDGAEPVTLASERNVLEVPTTRSGSPQRMTGPRSRAKALRTCLRAALTSSATGGSPRSQSRVTRPAPRGTDNAVSGSSS